MQTKTKQMLILLTGMSMVVMAKILSPAGYAPVISLALGMFMISKDQKGSMLALFLSLFISDLILSEIYGTSFSGFMSGGIFLAYYALYAFAQWVSPKLNSGILGGTIAGVVFFWISSNLLTFFEGQLYVQSIDGFINCYVQALPFLWKSLIGNLSVSIAIFGIMRKFHSVKIAA